MPPADSSSASVMYQQPVPGLVHGTAVLEPFPAIDWPAPIVPRLRMADANAFDGVVNGPDDM